MAADSKREVSSIILVICVAFFWSLVVEPAWHSRLRYSVQYGVSYSSVTKLKKPHTCDFLTGPIGNKNCSYEPQVTTVRTAISTEGKPIVSFDDGQHSVLNDGSPLVKPSLTIYWKKIDEDEE